MIIKSTRFILIDKPGSANKTSKTDPGLYDGVLPAQMTVAIIARDFRYEIWYIFIKFSTPVADYFFFLIYFFLLSIVKKRITPRKINFWGNIFLLVFSTHFGYGIKTVVIEILTSHTLSTLFCPVHPVFHWRVATTQHRSHFKQNLKKKKKIRNNNRCTCMLYTKKSYKQLKFNSWNQNLFRELFCKWQRLPNTSINHLTMLKKIYIIKGVKMVVTYRCVPIMHMEANF